MAFGKKKASSDFEYQPRSADTVRARATASGSREGFLADGVKTFSPKAGSHTVRILPPTWEEPKHYGYDVFAHYNVGPDGGAYLCLHKMQDQECAICEERQRALKEQDEELEQALRPRQRVACWVIDRDNERDGPMLWLMPWTLDREIVQQSINKKTGEVYNLDDPKEGFDVSFERQGDGPTTKYVGVQLDRHEGPLSDDEDDMKEWLKFVKDNPVPDQLVFQEPEYLADIVGEGLTLNTRDKKKAGKDKEEKETKSSKGKGKPERPQLRSRKANGADEDTDTDKGAKTKGGDDEPPTWEEVHALDEGELTALAEELEVDISDCDDEEAAADLICKEMDIEPPKKKKEEVSSVRGKMAALKSRLSKGK